MNGKREISVLFSETAERKMWGATEPFLCAWEDHGAEPQKGQAVSDQAGGPV